MSKTPQRTLSVVDSRGNPPSAGGGGDWRDQLSRNREHKLSPTAWNLQLIFENDSELKGLFKLDEFANRVVIHGNPPWRGCEGGEFTEIDGVELSAWLGRSSQFDGYEISAKTSMVLEVVEAVARRHKFHPVRDYLNGLAWDGIERIPKLLSAYCGTKDDEYHRRVAEIFMVSAVARIIRPGCKVDTMLVLEGEQGLGKTQVTQLLFGGDRWYMDAQRSPAEKDFYQDIVGKWGVEIGEMTSFSKAESNKVKQTLSATADTYRPSYGRYSRTFPRQCVFVGTTNEHEWVRDHTGGRRYLPVRVTRVDVPAITSVRDQLWAEAVVRLGKGADWWTLPDAAKEEQDERYIDDAWAQPVLLWLSGFDKPQSYEHLHFSVRDNTSANRPIMEVSVDEIMTCALRIDVGRIDRPGQMRVAAMLRRWGWSDLRTLRRGKQVRLWVAPADWVPLQSGGYWHGGDDVPF